MWFSSSRRAFEASQSKMPPQQPDRLLDVLNEGFGLGAHSRRNLVVVSGSGDW
jgi:hypothetical protein